MNVHASPRTFKSIPFLSRNYRLSLYIRDKKKFPGHVYLVTFPESREKRRDKRNPGNLETFRKLRFSPRIFLPV